MQGARSCGVILAHNFAPTFCTYEFPRMFRIILRHRPLKIMVVCSKHWVFTLNNYTDAEEQALEDLAELDVCEYIVFGKEVGDSGTPHLQGYVIFDKRISASTAKNLISTRAHVEKKKGTPEQAANYCKKDGEFKEFGSRATKQGRRSDLDELYDCVANGATKEEIRTQFKGTYVRYKRSIDTIITEINEKPRDRTNAPVVRVYWGLTGTGKTKSVFDEHDEESIYMHPGDRWFDGYNQHEVALFDDFDGGYFKLSYFLKLLDRYPMRVPVKGGFVQWAPKFIYITSNKEPKNWYPNAYEEHQNALMRRLTEIKWFGPSA